MSIVRFIVKMPLNKLFFVSIILFFYQVIGPCSSLRFSSNTKPSLPAAITSSFKTSISMNKPPSLMCFIKNSEPIDYCVGTFSAKIKPITSISTRSMQINNNLKDIGIVLSNVMDKAINISVKAIIKKILKAVASYLYIQIKKWLNNEPNEFDSVNDYFGLTKIFQNIINISMTEILYQGRKGIIIVKEIASLFYFVCDLKHMKKEDDSPIDLEYVKSKLYKQLEIFELKVHTSGIYDINSTNEDAIAKEIQNSLHSLPDKARPSFDASIYSMKTRVLIDQSNNVELNKLQNRFINEYGKSLHVLAESYESETDIEKIRMNHLQSYKIIATELFGRVLNHFRLLSKLVYLDSLNNDEKSTIDKFRPFMDIFMENVMERLFEFNGQIDTEFLRVVYPVIEFLNPSEPRKLNNYNKNTQSNNIALSIEDYYDRSMDLPFIDIYMKRIINDAVISLLKICGEDDYNNWENSRTTNIKILYEEKPNKECLLKSIEENARLAIITVKIILRK